MRQTRMLTIADDTGACQATDLPPLTMRTLDRITWPMGAVLGLLPFGPTAVLQRMGNVVGFGWFGVEWPVFLGLAISLVLSLMAMLWMGRRIRNEDLSPASRWSWLAIACFLGPLAIPLFLSLHAPVPRVRCGGCGRDHSVARVKCPRCEASLPLPAATGVEIFA